MTMNVMACCEVVIVYYKFVKANKFHRPMLTNEKYSENCRWRERERKRNIDIKQAKVYQQQEGKKLTN